MKILVVSSVSPRNIEHQRQALETWQGLGSRVVSLNHSSEVSMLSSITDSIMVVEQSNCATELLGKPFIYIDSFLEYFATQPESHLLIVNSDIFLSDPERLLKIFTHNPADLVFGQRVDVDDIHSLSGDLFPGFDYFLLTKEMASRYPRSSFCMGAPWWDHWMPIVPIVTGARAVLCQEPIAIHLKHEAAWGIEPLSKLGFHMAEQLAGLWNGFAQDFANEAEDSFGRKSYLLGSLFFQYFIQRRAISHSYYPKWDALHPDLKAEVSWDMTDVYPVVTLEFIMNTALKAELSSFE